MGLTENDGLLLHPYDIAHETTGNMLNNHKSGGVSCLQLWGYPVLRKRMWDNPRYDEQLKT